MKNKLLKGLVISIISISVISTGIISTKKINTTSKEKKRNIYVWQWQCDRKIKGC